MPYKKGFKIAILALLAPYMLWAQAPAIHYTAPPVFTINTPIAPLLPINNGGSVPAAQYGTVTTLAGAGAAGFLDENGTAARFTHPIDICFDKSTGNLYVADYGNHAVRKITPAGVVTTLAGGVGGFADGNGTAAKFNEVVSIAVDILGNVFVGEISNKLIRRIDQSGNVTTYAGLLNMPGNTDGPIATAKFDYPAGLVFNAGGDLLVADYNNALIREINRATSQVITIAGNNTRGNIDGVGIAASFKNPNHLAFDQQGNLYIADIGGNAIRKMDMTTGQVITVLLGPDPNGIVVDKTGNIYMASGGDNEIKELSASGKLTVVAGTFTPGDNADGIRSAAKFSNPTSLTLDNAGNLYVTDYNNNEIRQISITGYTIDKALPPGLTFNNTTGIISGTPNLAWPPTQYIVTGYNAEGSSETPIVIQVNGPATVNFAAIPTKDICDVDFDPGATSSQPPITYTSSNLAVATIVANQVHITGTGTSTITATSSGATATQVLTVTAISASPSVTIAADPANNNCIGSTLSFNATAASGGANPSYQWKVNGADANVNSPVFTSTTLSNNDIITCVLTNNDYCKPVISSPSNQVTVKVGANVDNVVNISATATSVYAATPVTFTAVTPKPPDVISYQWLVNSIAAGTNSAQFTSTTLADGDVITCKVTSGGCVVDALTQSNAITVTIKPVVTINVPNTFTPNGDGVNDLWTIAELVAFPNCTVNIFNRYGIVVFHSIGYTKSWSGVANNSPLPTGTYCYIIDPKDDHQKIIKGWVSILR